MTTRYIGLIIGATLLFLSITAKVNAQVLNETECTLSSLSFNEGNNFVLDTEHAVREGASFISSPTVAIVEDCKNHCCNDPNCNVALVENNEEKGSVKSCFLFNCLYKKEFVCRFVNKLGFTNYILETVYDDYLGVPETTRADSDKFPIAKAGRDVVVQPSEKVTLNGIESWDDKPITSYKWTLITGNNTVKITNGQFEDQVVLSNLHSGMYLFQLMVTDSIGQHAVDQVSVLVLTPEQSENHCLIPAKVGPCRGAFVRWHYNAASQNCENFTFGGCKGNDNNYVSEQECSDACNGASEKAVRRLHPETEVCSSTCHPDQFTCQSGCCIEQSLECDNVKQCSDGSDEASCDNLDRNFSRLLAITVDRKKARCTQGPRTGPCRASHTRWYYDPLNQKCSRFTFGGCDGNDNNFETEDTCISTCQGVTEADVFARSSFERQEEEEESRSGSVALAVVLCVAIMALLAVLGYCFLKNRKDRARHQPVPTTIPNDATVYQSTTKPI